MSTATPTKPGIPKLSEIARRVHAPAGIVSTGWPAVEAKVADLGITFRPWQVPVGRLILAKRAGGTYASTIGGTGLSIPRQVGKTFLVAAIMFALCLLRPGFTVLWTAHRLKTAEETFGKLQVFAKRRKIAPYVQQVKTGSGEQQIIFRNGSRILFGARERGFGRGFDEVDALVFDEAQHMTDSALDDMVPSTNQSRQPEGALMLFMGTPPRPQDPGEVFNRMRNDAAAGDEDTGWVEFGADPDYVPTPLPQELTDADWGQISAANPSFPEDTSRTAILRMRKKLGDDSFLREGLGIWTDRLSTRERFAAAWKRLRDEQSSAVDPVAFAVEVNGARSKAAIGVVGAREDGLIHVEVAEHRDGAGWVVGRVVEMVEKWHPCAVVVDEKGAAGSLVEPLRQAGIEVAVPTARDVAAAAGRLYDACQPETASLRHRGQDTLDAAVASASTRPLGDAWTWNRRDPTADITPLVAVTLALWGFDEHGSGGPSIW